MHKFEAYCYVNKSLAKNSWVSLADVEKKFAELEKQDSMKG